MTLTSRISSPATAPPKVSLESVHDAVQSLLNWRNSKTLRQKPQLLDEEDFVYLILTLKKIPPKGRTNPYKIPLPNPLHSDISELCLFIDDRSRSSFSKDASKKKIQSENIPISKIIKFSKLKSDYRAFEEKRKLCDSYDAFFTDKSLIHLLPRLLGKHFFKKKKIPVPLDLKRKNWKEQIRNACQSALLYLKTGTCSVLRVAKTSMELGEIEENVIAAINGMAEIIPNKWGNVRSIHLKLLESVALPIYQTVPDMKLKIEGMIQKKEVASEEKEKDVKGSKGNKDNKVSKKRGRIHEVRYMDNDAEEEAGQIEEGQDDEMGSGELRSKKTKKGMKVKKAFSGDLNDEREVKKSTIATAKNKEGVRYTDNDAEEEAGQIEEGQDDKMGSGELRSKKTKKGMKVKKAFSGDLNDEKEVKKSTIATAKNKEGVKQRMEGKSGVGKSKATRKMVKAK